jgi:hypothetical protein
MTATAAPAPPVGQGGAADPGPPPWWRRTWVVGAALLALLAIPLAVGLGVLHSPRWYPILDLAQTELRVRDVGTRHTPLVGLAGRIESQGLRGSHPGPLSFYGLRPVYTLLGERPWGLQVATATVHLAAMAAALWIAARRGGVRLMVAMGAVLAVLGHLYGATTLTEAWNPYLPIMWWLVFVLAAWSVLCDDLAMLPVAVFAGSWCLQTHISYLGLVAGLGAALAVVVAVAAWRRRRDRDARRRLAGWVAAALGLGVVLWLPPLYDQVRHDPGNLSIVVDNFRHPTDTVIGPGRGLRLVAAHLDLWHLRGASIEQAGAAWAGYALVAAWLVSVAVAAGRRANPALLRLDAVLGLVLVLNLVSASRIFGTVWFYLTLWSWVTATLMVLAIGWTVAAVAPPGARRAAPWLAGAVAVAFAALFVADAARVDVPSAAESHVLGRLARPTVAALAAPGAPGGGRDGHYRVTWVDPVSLGAAGEGLILELERRGFDARGTATEEEALGAHRVIAPRDATGEIHIAVGNDIARWRRAHPESRQVAYVDPRTPAERARYQRLLRRARDQLAAAGLDPAGLEDRLALVSFAPGTPEDARRTVNALADLGQPAAVFVTDQVTDL